VKRLVAVLCLAAFLVIGPASAATMDAIITTNRLGPLRLNKTTLAEAKAQLGEPTKINPIGQGCWDRMKRLSWGDDLKILFVYSRNHHVVHTPKVMSKQFPVSGNDRWRAATARGLEVGDTKERMLELYPNADNNGSGRTYNLVIKDGYKYLTATLDSDGRVASLLASETC
jgi:hypothetical protein